MNATSIRGFAAHVSEVAAAVFGSIRVEDLFVETLKRNANAVVGMALWREVGHHHKPGSTGAIASHEADHGVAIVVAINPLETELIKVIAPQGWLRLVQHIQIINKALNSLVRLVIE